MALDDVKASSRLLLRLVRNWWQDAAALAALAAAAVILDYDFLTTGDYLPLSSDWAGHMYRTRFFQEYGLATWDHNWAGGISLFQSYQFVANAVTALFAKLIGASIGRSMLFEQGLLLVWVRISGYLVARALGLPPGAGLVAGVATFGLNNYASPIYAFSSLWGLALVPVFLAAAYRYHNRPAVYVVAVVIGLSIYVHPHATVSGVVILISAVLIAPPTVRRLGRLVAQGGLVALASAFYWMPILFSAKPVIHDQYSASVAFLRSMFGWGVDCFSDVLWLLLPLIAAATIAFWREVRYPLLRYVGAFLALELFLIALSYAGAGPESLRIMQNVRLLIVLPLAVGLWASIAADAALRRTSTFGRWRLAGMAGIVFAALILAVPIVRFAGDQPLRPAWTGPDPVSDWLSAHQEELEGRIWFDDVETPWYTYRHFDDVRGSQSHFPTGEWSLLKRRLLGGMLSGKDFDTTEEYMKAMAVSYVVLPDTRLPLAEELGPGGSLEGRLKAVAHVPGYAIYQVPWEPVEAFYTDIGELPSLDFPHTTYQNVSDQALRDGLVREYNQLAYSGAAQPVRVEYPSATTIRVRLPDLPQGQYLVVTENWDRTWHARTTDGRSLRTERFGPNYLGIDLSELQGGAVVELRHGMARDWQAGMALTFLSVPMGVALMVAERRRDRAVQPQL